MSDTKDPTAARSREPARPLGGASPLADQVRSLRLPPPEPPRRGGSWFPWLVCLASLGAAAWFYVQWQAARQALGVRVEPAATASNAASSNPSGSNASKPRVAGVADAGGIALEYPGYVIPAHQILVSPQVSGRLVSLNVDEGRRVTKGELLAEIESTEYRADHARALAALALAEQQLLELTTGNRPEEIEQSRAELAEFQAQLSQLAAEYDRNSALVKNLLIPPQEFEISESKYRAMEGRVKRMTYALKLMEDGPRQERIDSAKAEVEQARAEVEKARWRLDNCKILAPISGTILKKNAEEGNIVNPIAFNGSFSICELADLSDLEVSLDVQERDIAQVYPGQRCKVRAAEAYPDRGYDGIVSRLMPIADRAKGSIQVRVQVSVPTDEEGVYLKPEMSAKVIFFRDSGSGEATSTESNAEADPTPPEAGAVGLPGATSGSKSDPAPPPPSTDSGDSSSGDSRSGDTTGAPSAAAERSSVEGATAAPPAPPKGAAESSTGESESSAAPRSSTPGEASRTPPPKPESKLDSPTNQESAERPASGSEPASPGSPVESGDR